MDKTRSTEARDEWAFRLIYGTTVDGNAGTTRAEWGGMLTEKGDCLWLDRLTGSIWSSERNSSLPLYANCPGRMSERNVGLQHPLYAYSYHQLVTSPEG